MFAQQVLDGLNYLPSPGFIFRGRDQRAPQCSVQTPCLSCVSVDRDPVRVSRGWELRE